MGYRVEGRGTGRKRTGLTWNRSKMRRARFSSPFSKIIISSKYCNFKSHRLAVLNSVSCVCYARSTDGVAIFSFLQVGYSFSIVFWMIPVPIITLPVSGFLFSVFDFFQPPKCSSLTKSPRVRLRSRVGTIFCVAS